MTQEQEMIRRCIRGENKALAELYDRHAPLLMGVCMRYLSSRPDAEDVLQEVFIRILQNLHRFEYRGDGSLSGWMRRIAVNLSLNFLRNKKKMLLIFDPDDPPSVAEESNQDWIAHEIPQDQLTHLINSLPAGYRTVLNLYVFENYSHREIAQALGCTESNSRSQLLRARALLKKNMMDYLLNDSNMPAYGR